MKIAFLSDLQLEAGRPLGNGEYGPGSRFRDQEDALDRIAALTAEEQVDLVCILGDIFEYAAPKPWAILAFQRFVRTLRDAGQQVLVIGGNHDWKSAALPTALEIFGEHNIVCALTPSLFPFEDVVVATLPWTPLAQLVLDQPALSRDEVHDVAAQALLHSARVLADRCADEYPGLKSVLVGHWAISGATLPTGLGTEMMREAIIPLEGLAKAGFSLAAFGHVHKAQVLEKHPPVFYCGSPWIVNWGEASIPHGIWVYDTAGALRFHEVEDRRLVTLDMDAEHARGYVGAMADYTDALVRVRYTVSEAEAGTIDQARIRAALLEAGATKVFIQGTVERAERARVEAFAEESVGATDAFELWLASRNGSLAVDQDRLRTLHADYETRARA